MMTTLIMFYFSSRVEHLLELLNVILPQYPSVRGRVPSHNVPESLRLASSKLSSNADRLLISYFYPPCIKPPTKVSKPLSSSFFFIIKKSIVDEIALQNWGRAVCKIKAWNKEKKTNNELHRQNDLPKQRERGMPIFKTTSIPLQPMTIFGIWCHAWKLGC